MKTAIQKLLSLRPNSKYVNVSLKKYRGGKANLCFQNAAIYAATRDGYEIVSGWMVGDNVEGFGTILVPHYWLIHLPTGTYFDTTPRAIGDHQMYEYVIDMDIYKHVTQASYPSSSSASRRRINTSKIRNEEFYQHREDRYSAAIQSHSRLN